jgi:hypothetical protein
MNPSLCLTLHRFVADAPVVRYAKIAISLPDKTVRDVALRCRWMAVSCMLSMSCIFVDPFDIYMNMKKQRVHYFVFLGMIS